MIATAPVPRHSDSPALPRTNSVVSAIVQPLLMVAVYVACALTEHGDLALEDLILCFVVFALAFPGKDRSSVALRFAVPEMLAGWGGLLIVLSLCGWLTNSLELFERRVVLPWVLITPCLMIAAMVLTRAWSDRSRLAGELPRAVVVGGGPSTAGTVQALQASGANGVQVMGIFDDRDATRATESTGLPLLGGLKDLAAYVSRHRIQKIFITMPLNTQPRIQALVDSIGDTTAEMYYVPDVFGVSIIRGRLAMMDGVPVVGLLESPFTGVNGMVKRASDIVLSSVALLVASPLLLGCAIAVRLSSPGPIVFRQKRHGVDGKEIMVYKFRSMTTMDNGNVVKQASRDDVRVTPVGRVLRKTSLDELPQLVNVLQGRMSMVGPRPHAIAHNEQYRTLITAYMVRHKVKPGITGWAQIHGHRGPTETVDKMQTRVEYDLEYLRNWSLRLDLEILVRTVTTVLFDKHAF